MSVDAPLGSNWSDEDWDHLLEDIHKGAVIPIVSEELYTVAGADGVERPLYTDLAQKLAAQLKLELPPGWEIERPLNEVICAYLRTRKRDNKLIELDRVYDRFCDLFTGLNPQPSAALRMLAEIRDFKLLVTTTPDDLLERAMDQARFHGHGTTSLAFTLKAPYEDLRCPAKASPDESPTVYHLFGRLAKLKPDQFVLSDDDLLEFFFAIQSLRREELPNLRDALQRSRLLFLGGSLSDWLVRILLRVANGDRRLCKREHYDVLEAVSTAQESGLIKFLKFFSPGTKLAPFNAQDFVAQLHDRWKKAYPAEAEKGVVPPPLPDRMPEDSVFLSYASEDREAVAMLRSHLSSAKLDVWFDRDQLMAGHDWHLEIQKNIRRCSFFIPVISRNTQRLLHDVYFREEWRRAHEIAMRSYKGTVFILPVLLEERNALEEIHDPLAIEESFETKNFTIAPQGEPPSGFIDRLKQLTEERRKNPIRRPL